MLQWGAGSQTTGPALVTEHVRQVVGPSARVSLVDGSGLSELNRISPLTQMLYLARYPQLPGNERFPLLLPANGTGTLAPPAGRHGTRRGPRQDRHPGQRRRRSPGISAARTACW